MARNLLTALSSRGALLLAFALFALMPVQAATINVDSTCTINQAITSANSDSTASGSSCEAGSGADTINISGTHNTTANLPGVGTAVTIVGSGNATVNGGNQYKLFLVNSGGNLTIRNLTITGGSTEFGGGVETVGGAVSLTIENSVIHGNSSTRSGGGIDAITSFTIRNSVFYNNYSSRSSGSAIASGGASSTVVIENSTFYNHTRDASNPAVTVAIIIANSGLNATLTHVTMVNNKNSLKLDDGTLNLRNSIITGSIGYDCGRHPTNRGTLNIVNSIISDGSCSATLSGDPMLAPLSGGVFPLREGSPAIDAASSSHCLATDQRGVARVSTACDIGAYEGFISRPKKSESKEEEGPYIPPTPMPPTYTGEGFFGQTGIRVSATHGLRSGVQFKRIDASGIGNEQVLINGFIDAVDVFGYVEQGVEVCFPQAGALIFLDAATSPRAVLPWPSTIVDGFTCGRIDRPGTLVLVPHNSRLAGPVSTPQPFPGPQSQTNSSAQITLTDCYLTTTHILNLRDTPGGDIIGRVNYNATLSATGRQGAWYQISVDGLSGWISADFVRTRGNCS